MQNQLWLRHLHRLSAMLLAAYLVLHLTNHVVGLSGQGQHIRFMTSIRPFYRNAVVEPLLLGLLLFQIGSDVTMVIRGWRARRGFVAWVQALSGLYLAAFILNHVISVLAGRWALGLDTDFRFAAAGMHVPPLEWFFVPYYWLGVAALFTHVGCAIYWSMLERNSRTGRLALSGLALTGILLGGAIVSALAGVLHPVSIPAKYLATYKS